MSAPTADTWDRIEGMTVREVCRWAALVAFLVYLPSIAGPFLYDDANVVLDNPSITSLRHPWLTFTYNRTRPLLNFSWALNHAVSGREPWSYHLVNILIHAANAALVGWLLTWIAARAAIVRPRAAALVGALFFAASPMACETVAYVASRSTALATLLGLACLVQALRAFDDGKERRLGLALLFLLLGLLTKEEAAAVPLLLVLLDFFFLARQDGRALRSRLHLHALFFAIPVLGLVARRFLIGAWLPEPVMPRELYAFFEIAAFPGYLLRQLIPLDPSLYRGHGASWPPPITTWLLALLTPVILVAAVLGRASRVVWSFAVLWLVAALLPSSSIAPLAEIVADHRAYLGSIGVAFALAAWLTRVARPRTVAVIVALLSLRSLQYEWVLADPVRAWSSVCVREPDSPLALRALAEAYAAAGEPARAEWAFSQALALAPGDPQTLTNLSTFYAESERFADALRVLDEAMPRMPPSEQGRLHDNRGTILLRLGREAEAITELETAARLDPGRPQPLLTLAQTFLKRGDTARARALIEEVARSQQLTPEDAVWIERLRAQTEPGYRRPEAHP